MRDLEIAENRKLEIPEIVRLEQRWIIVAREIRAETGRGLGERGLGKEGEEEEEEFRENGMINRPGCLLQPE